jgi:hypothetical protein
MNTEPEHYDPLDGSLLPLIPELEQFVLEFMSEIRSLIASERIGPGEAIQASKALFALSRLPLTTPGMIIEVDAAESSDDGQVIFSASLSEREFSLTAIESIYGPFGSDRQSQNFLTASPGSSLRTDFNDPVDAAREWLLQWTQIAGTGRVRISDNADESGWQDEEELSPSWDDLSHA